MSLWHYMFEEDWLQRRDIGDLQDRTRRTNRRIRRTTSRLEDRIDELEQEVGELALLCRTLFAVLGESGTIDPAKFEEAFRRIDAEDGTEDGRITPPKKEIKVEVTPRHKKRPRK